MMSLLHKRPMAQIRQGLLDLFFDVHHEWTAQRLRGEISAGQD